VNLNIILALMPSCQNAKSEDLIPERLPRPSNLPFRADGVGVQGIRGGPLYSREVGKLLGESGPFLTALCGTKGKMVPRKGRRPGGAEIWGKER